MERTRVRSPVCMGDTRDRTFALKRNRAFADLGPQTNLNLRKKSVCLLPWSCPALRPTLEIKMESARQRGKKRLTRLDPVKSRSKYFFLLFFSFELDKDPSTDL